MFSKRWQRNIFRILGGTIFLIIIILFIGYFFPLPAFIVKPIITSFVTKIKPTWQVEYSRARIFLVQHQLKLKDVRITDTTSTGTLTIRGVTFDIRAYPPQIKSVIVEQPSEIGIFIPARSGERIETDNPIINDLLMAPRQQTTVIPSMTVSIRRADLQLFASRQTVPETTIKFKDLNVELDFAEGKILGSGFARVSIFNTQESLLMFQTTYQADKNSWNVNLRTPVLEFPLESTQKQHLVKIKKGALSLEISAEPSVTLVFTRFNADQVTVIPEMTTPSVYELDNIQFSAEILRLQRTKNLIEVRNLSYQDKDLFLSCSGKINTGKEDKKFDIQISAETRSTKIFKQVLEKLNYPEQFQLKVLPDTSLSLTGKLAGTFQPLAFTDYDLTCLVKSLSVQLPAENEITFPILRCSLKNNLLEVERMSGEGTLGTFIFEGRAKKTLADENWKLDYSTSATLSVEPTLKLIKSIPAVEQYLKPALTSLNYRGTISADCRGKINVIFKDKWKLKILQFSARVTTPDLEIEVADKRIKPFIIRGTLTANETQLVLQNFESEIEGFPLNLRGRIVGYRYFWETPQWEFYINGNCETNRLVDKLQKYVLNNFTHTKAGKFNYEVHIKRDKTSAQQLKDTVFVTTQIDNLNLQFPQLTLGISNCHSKLKYTDQKITIESASAEINSIPLKINGEVSSKNVNLQLTSSIELEKLRESLMQLLEPFIMDGKTDVTLRLQFQNPYRQIAISRNQAELFSSEMLEEYKNLFGALLTCLKNPDNYPEIINGELNLHHNTFYYWEFPQPINNITGTMHLRGNRLEFQNLRADCGHSTDSLHSGAIYLKNGVPVMEIKSRLKNFYLLDWTDGWKSQNSSQTKIEGTSVSPQPSGKLAFYVVINAEGDKVFIPPLIGENFKTRFEYFNFTGEVPNKIRFTDTKARFLGGECFLDEGIINILHGDTNHSWQVRVQNVNLEELATRLAKTSPGATGNFSCSLTIRGEGDDLDKLSGEGKFNINQSRFINNPVFLALAEATRLPYFKDVSFADVSGEIVIANQQVTFKNTIFESPLMRLMAEGSVGFDEKLSGEVSLAIFSGLASNIPLIGSLTGRIFQYIESYGSYVAKLKMQGTLSQPRFNPVPLSVDELRKLPSTLLRFINRLHPF